MLNDPQWTRVQKRLGYNSIIDYIITDNALMKESSDVFNNNNNNKLYNVDKTWIGDTLAQGKSLSLYSKNPFHWGKHSSDRKKPARNMDDKHTKTTAGSFSP